MRLLYTAFFDDDKTRPDCKQLLALMNHEIGCSGKDLKNGSSSYGLGCHEVVLIV